MSSTSDVRFLPSYVGSKRAWLRHERIAALAGRPFVELFAGSGVLSANLASSALLNDLDPMVCRILGEFDQQVVPEVFTRADYYRLRAAPDWWRHAFCLQSLSYSGVFRYSKAGYNVPAKGGPDPARNRVNAWNLRPAYEVALRRWGELCPDVRRGSYDSVPLDAMAALGDPVVVCDPPYQGSQAAYNSTFDYGAYWARVAELAEHFDVLVFDRRSNLLRQSLPVHDVRKMRVNGARPGDVEAVSFLFGSPRQ